MRVATATHGDLLQPAAISSTDLIYLTCSILILHQWFIIFYSVFKLKFNNILFVFKFYVIRIYIQNHWCYIFFLNLCVFNYHFYLFTFVYN